MISSCGVCCPISTVYKTQMTKASLKTKSITPRAIWHHETSNPTKENSGYHNTEKYKEALQELWLTKQTWLSPRTTQHTTRLANGIKKPQSQRYESLKGVDSKFLKNLHFAKKHIKKGLKKMQANNAKAVSIGVEAIKALVKPQAIKPMMPKDHSPKLRCLAFIAHPKLGKKFRSYMAKGHRHYHQSPCFKPRQRPKLHLRPRLQFQLRPPKVLRAL
uniref:Large ribosomal subunit protein eL29 n=1 Tax=Rattus norvegicus TaxID=10116 RepID=A0ABK0LTJ0_RAT